jgi:hypothetical protein
VVGPDGRPVAHARVIGVSTVPHGIPPAIDGVEADADGTFAFRRIGSPSVTLRAWHPALSPDPEGGTATFDASTETAVLRLAAPALAGRFTLADPLPDGFADHGAVRVVLFPEPAVPGSPGEEHVAVVVDGALQFAHEARGVYSVFVDPPSTFEHRIEGAGTFVRALPSRVPLMLHGVRFDGPRTDLGRLAFTAGSTLRAKIGTYMGTPRDAFVLTVEALDQPSYVRRLHGAAAVDAGLSGLRRGRFRVAIGYDSEQEPYGNSREVVSDGEHDVEVNF